jgi:hypothetical protein
VSSIVLDSEMPDGRGAGRRNALSMLAASIARQFL